ncbi:hypothetical protein CC2G_004192 [Coprinopsis cinerea AmutBmut pab1-1]|nr:hypothetical protein CC2G_004192 [Coprinopsis cinerea AmutBmut pab1-1]
MGQRKEFIAEMTKDFMDTFPITAGTAGNVQRYGAQRALEIANYKRKDELRHWYYNNTRPSSGAGARGILRPKKKKKKHAWQAYSQLYWDKGLSEKVNNLCMLRHQKPLEEFGPQERFTIRNKLVKQLLDLEAPDVLKKVDEWRESEVTMKQPLSNEVLAENIRKVPKTMKVFTDMIDEETDWVGGMIMGGPDPLNGGEPMNYIRIWGTNKDGQSFESFLGEDRYKRWIRAIKKWIASCYDDHDRAARKMEGHEAPARDESDDEVTSDSDHYLDDDDDNNEESNETSDNEEDQRKANEHTREEAAALVTPAVPPLRDTDKANKSGGSLSSSSKSNLNSKAKSKETGKDESNGRGGQQSDYEMSREVLMARNKVMMGIIDKSVEEGSVRETLLGELRSAGVQLPEDQLADLLNSIDDIFTKSNKGKKSKAGQSSSNKSAGPASTTTTPTKDAAAPQVQATATTTTEDTATNTTPTAPQVQATATAIATNDAAAPGPTTAPQVQATPTSTTEDTATNTTPTAPQVQATPTSTTEDTATNTTPTAPQVQATATAIATNDAAAPGPTTAPQVQATPTSTTEDTVTNTTPQGQTVDGEPMDVDSPKEGESPPPEAPLSLEGVVIPVWMKATWPYLLGLSMSRSWRSLLLAFANWEATKPKTGNLNTQHRPKQVQAWIRSHKKDIPPDVSTERYSAEFLTWYRNLQPEWRVVGVEGNDPSAFAREVPAEASWGCIRNGGSAGLYTVLMALSWWIVKSRGAIESTAASVISDMTWLLEELKSVPAPEAAAPSQSSGRSASKSGNEGAQGGRSNKRSVILHPHCDDDFYDDRTGVAPSADAIIGDSLGLFSSEESPEWPGIEGSAMNVDERSSSALSSVRSGGGASSSNSSDEGDLSDSPEY